MFLFLYAIIDVINTFFKIKYYEFIAFIYFFLWSYAKTFFDQIEKRIVKDKDFFAEGIIKNDYNFLLGEHYSSDLYIIENKNRLYLVKQNDGDFHFELEKDFIITIIAEELRKKFFIKNMQFCYVWYIPAFVHSVIKKNIEGAALVISLCDKCSFLDYQWTLQLKTDLPYAKKALTDNQKGLTVRVLDTMEQDDRFIFLVALDTFFANFDRHNENILCLDNGVIVPIDQGGCYQINALAIDIINSIEKLHNNYKYKKVLEKYYYYIDNFYNIFQEKDAIQCIKKMTELYDSVQMEKRIPLATMINNIRVHYFFINYLLKNKNYII